MVRTHFCNCEIDEIIQKNIFHLFQFFHDMMNLTPGPQDLYLFVVQFYSIFFQFINLNSTNIFFKRSFLITKYQ